MTRLALGDVPKMPRHRSLRAIHSGSSSYGRRPTNVSCARRVAPPARARTLSVSPEPSTSIVTGSARCSRIAAARTTCSSPCSGMKLAYTNTRKSSCVTSGRGRITSSSAPTQRRRSLARGVPSSVAKCSPCASVSTSTRSANPHANRSSRSRRCDLNQPPVVWRSSAVSCSDTNASNRTGASRSRATAFAAATSAWPGNPTSMRSMGSAKARRISERCAAGVGPRVGDDEHFGPCTPECLGHDPVPGVRRVEVSEVRDPEPGERRLRHRRRA